MEIPPIIHTNIFLRFVAAYFQKFKRSNGRGRWLAEYRRMEEQGMFEPKKLRALYIDILKDTSKLSFIYWDAINYICVQALDAAKTYVETNLFEIRVITGEIAFDDSDKELKELSIEEAISICKTMNKEAEENLFMVYNSVTNKKLIYEN